MASSGTATGRALFCGKLLYSLKCRCTKSLRPSQLASKLLEYIPMERLFQPLLFFVARCSRNQLIRQIEFLRAENEMLRKRLPQAENPYHAG